MHLDFSKQVNLFRRHLRLKTESKEDILRRLMGEKGLKKVYSLFNTSKAPGKYPRFLVSLLTRF